MSEQLWCPTRGYFVIGAGGGPAAGRPSGEASPSEAPPPAGEVASSAAETAPAAASVSSGDAGPGSRVWAPTRGYFTSGGGASKPAAAAKPAAQPKPAAATPAAAAAPSTAGAAAPPPPPKVAVAAKKEPAKPAGKDAPAPSKKAAAPDPEVVSVTRVPGLTEVAAFKEISKIVYDDPDSETTLYRVPTLNVAFAILSLILLVSIVAVIWQDYDRSWKRIQKDFRSELVQSYREQLHERSAKSFGALAALERPLVQMAEKLGVTVPLLPAVPADTNANAYEEIDYRRFRGQANRVERLIAIVTEALDQDPEYARLASAASDAANAANMADAALRYKRGEQQARISYLRLEKEHVIAEHGMTSSAYRELVKKDEEYATSWELEVEKLARELEEAQIAANEAKAQWLAYEEERTRVDGEGPVTLSSVRAALAEIGQPISVHEGQIAEVEGSLANKLRDAVLLDALAPTVTIRKVVIDDITEPLNFLDVARVDRCATCHINIDAVEPRFDNFESHKWGSVYQPHPRPDLYLQDTSPHPYLQFGCTGCHYGDGRATDFVIAAHMPDDEKQGKEWETRFHWHEKHHQVQPMRREKHLTGSCRKCHSDEDHVDGADQLNLGLATVREFGCFGCHRMENFDVIVGEPEGPEDLWKRHKVGPNLRYIADKTTPEFLYKWIRDPRHFRPSTRMPRFFDLSNTSGEMHVVQSDGSVKVLKFDDRNGVEALALATYLHDTSGSRSLAPPEAQGDPTRGRELVASLGCLGCHSVKRESVRPDTPSLDDLRDAAPRLARTLRDRAVQARQGASGSDAQAQLADRYEEIGGALTELSSWFERLLPHRDLEGLYSSVRVPLYRARVLEERLGVAESPLDEIETVASGFYDHWAHNTFAPDLSTIGSKFDVESEAGRQSAVAWLTDWILDPTRHNPETVMPRFRLESDDDGEQSVADIVAYLLTLRDPDFEATEALTPETLDEEKLATLRELTFNHLRASYSTARAQEISRSMPVEDQLRFVGHRLVRRYGCFGCHNGIADIDPDPGRAQTELVDADSVPTFDHAQPIGTELSTWGDKDVNRLDYGPWGHQPDGTAAIAHDRKDWLAAKLSDTRRFDVFPARKWVDKAEGHAVYVPTDRLIQKRPDELLVMPLFPFHDEPEVVDAVVTFVTSLVGDKIPVTKRNVLDGEERDIELGSRLVRKYNCLGCHRIGAETRTVALSELPSFTDLHEEDSRRAEWQKETWLARDFEVTRPLPSAPNASASLTLLKGMLLNIGTLDPTVDRDSPRAAVVDPVTVAQLIHRHYDPLPAFAQSVLQVLDEYADAEAVDPNVSAFVSAALAAAPGTNRFTEFLTRVRKAAFEESDQPYGAMLARLFDRPYDPAVVDWLATPEGDGEIWADLAREFYGRPLRRFSERNQRIPVRGLNEGSIRYYFGTDAESRSNAPPPLVRQGERVRADWLFHFLLDVHPIRPWLKVRMPSFTLTQDEARAIVAWFRSLSELPNGSELFEADRFVDAEAQKGRDLFRNTFECFKCHPTGNQLPTLPLLTAANGVEPKDIPVTAPGDSYFLAIREPSGRVVVQAGFPDAESAEAEGRKLSEGTQWAVGEPWSKSNWGPDLGLAAARLRPDWLFAWLMSPKDFMPGTKMPHFFGERERFAGAWDSHLAPERREEIRALIQYLVHMQRLDGGDIVPLGGGG